MQGESLTLSFSIDSDTMLMSLVTHMNRQPPGGGGGVTT